MKIIRYLFEKLNNKDRDRILHHIKHHDILTLEEAVIYLRTDAETLLSEVIKGKIPAGKIGGRWCFYKNAIVEHLWCYQNVQSDSCPPFEDYNFESASIAELLKPNPQLVKQVIAEYQKGKRVFDGVDLPGADFSNQCLKDIDLSLSELIGANFRDCNLSNSDFSQTNCRDADFTGADLTSVNFQGADLTNANFTGTIVVKSNLVKAKISGINLKNAKIVNPIF